MSTFKKAAQLFSNQTFKISTIGSISTKFLSALFAFASGALLARSMNLQGYGIYTLAFTTITLLSIPASLGLPTLITRYISKYEVHENRSAIKGLLISANLFVWIMSCVIGAIAFITYLFWWKTYNSSLVSTLWYGFLLLPVLSLGSLRAATLTGMRLVLLGQIPDTLLRNFLLFAGVLLFPLFGGSLSPQIAMIIHAVAALLSFFVGHYFLNKKLLKNLKNVRPVYHNREWLKQAWPFSVNSGVQIIKSKLLTYVLAAFGSLSAVAVFDVALRGASLVAYTLDAVNTATGPFVSNAFEKKNHTQLQGIITKTTRVTFFFALPVAATFIIGGSSFINILFGSRYEDSYLPLVFLCIGQLFNAAAGSVGLVLNMTGNQSYFLKINSYMTLINIGLSIPLVIFFDVNGAAAIYSGILILQNSILVLYVKKRLDLKTMIF